MIRIREKAKCCGCAACVQICPKQCISFISDEEGFSYPVVNEEICIKCGLCDKVCLSNHTVELISPIGVFESVNDNVATKYNSSSGGIFSAIAEEVINRKGVVFGASFDENWEVHHTWTESKEGLGAFRGSKYVQSMIGSSFKVAEAFLKEGRFVLFSGTGCQIAALKRYLRNEYDNLLTTDFICHGVPSPLIWRKYLEESQCKFVNVAKSAGSNEGQQIVISSISFRDKENGWKNYCLSIKGEYYGLCNNSSSCEHESIDLITENHKTNIYLKGYFSNVFIRPSCYKCPSKSNYSVADITLADFWGVERLETSFDLSGGISLVLTNTEKGDIFYKGLEGIHRTDRMLKDAIALNPSYCKSCKLPDNRSKFWRAIKRGNTVCDSIKRYATPSIRERMRSFTIKVMVRLNILNLLKKNPL